MSDDCQSNAEIPTPLGPVKIATKRMAETISILCLCLLIGLAVLYWQHAQDTKDANRDLAQAIKELTTAQRDMVAAQRETTCVISLPQERREQQFSSSDSFCRRIARMP